MTIQRSKAPAIDIDMLTMALQAADLDTSWWLDTHSGDVIPAPEDSGDAAERRLIKAQQQHPDRYIAIEPIDEAVHIELMQSYVATLEEETLCDALHEALAKKKLISLGIQTIIVRMLFSGFKKKAIPGMKLIPTIIIGSWRTAISGKFQLMKLWFLPQDLLFCIH